MPRTRCTILRSDRPTRTGLQLGLGRNWTSDRHGRTRKPLVDKPVGTMLAPGMVDRCGRSPGPTPHVTESWRIHSADGARGQSLSTRSPAPWRRTPGPPSERQGQRGQQGHVGYGARHRGLGGQGRPRGGEPGRADGRLLRPPGGRRGAAVARLDRRRHAASPDRRPGPALGGRRGHPRGGLYPPEPAGDREGVAGEPVVPDAPGPQLGDAPAARDRRRHQRVPAARPISRRRAAPTIGRGSSATARTPRSARARVSRPRSRPASRAASARSIWR